MKYGKYLLAALLCLSLSGCGVLPYPREMENMALLRTMGVDRCEKGLRLTASTGPRARGLQGEREEALTLAAEGTSFGGAADALQRMSDSYVFFGYVDQLLVGETLAREGLEDTLDYLARDGELSLGAQLWVVRGSAEAGVEAGGEQGVDSRLETLRDDGKMGLSGIPRSAGDVFADILEQGAAYIPAVRAGREGSAVLTDAGYAVLRGDALAGFLEGEAARGLELLEGRPSALVLEEEAAGERMSARFTWARTRVRFLEDGRGLSLTVWAGAQLDGGGRPTDERAREALWGRLAVRGEAQIRAALGQLRAWGADCAGLGARAALYAPGLWAEAGAEWPARFAESEFEIDVQVEIQA